jgi:hypothetical protein
MKEFRKPPVPQPIKLADAPIAKTDGKLPPIQR